MQTNLLWTGREYHSLENCLVNTTGQGSEITSVIIGAYQGVIYRVDYRILTNQKWETTFFEIRSQHSNLKDHVIFEKDRNGNWLRDGYVAPAFKECFDIDIPLTPFTNTLPINRLQLNPGGGQEINVIYVDVLHRTMEPVKQKYIRLTDRLYRYENVPNDFQAEIEADEHGFVVDYPQLFVRTAKLAASYSQE